MSSTDLNRRQALRRMVMGGAATIAAPLWVENLLAIADQHAAHRAAAPKTAASWTPKVLNPQQNELVVAVSELIIPQTDTPGAKAAKVNEYIDGVLTDANAADREKFLQGLTWIDARSEDRYRARFVNAAPEQQIELLTALSTSPPAPAPDDAAGVAFFDAIKGMTIAGYYTSEIGLKQEIGDDGQMFFAEFKGCTHPEHGA
jgi:hypothetical protein